MWDWYFIIFFLKRIVNLEFFTIMQKKWVHRLWNFFFSKKFFVMKIFTLKNKCMKNVLPSDCLNREMRFFGMPITLPSTRTMACRKLEHFENFRRDLLNFSPETPSPPLPRTTQIYFHIIYFSFSPAERSVRYFRVRLHIALIDFEHSHEHVTL